MTDYDLIVIGAGSGGIAAAIRASSYGARVLLIEAQHLGGTCVNVGCVPKKITWQAAHFAHMSQYAQDHGVDLKLKKIHWKTLINRRQAFINRLHQIYQHRLKEHGITVITGHARLVDHHTVEVDHQQHTSRRIILATGGRPKRPTIPGHTWGITSDDFFALKKAPKNFAVIGSGYIACELAAMMSQLGSQVTLFARHERVLRGFDPMIGEQVMTHMEQLGVKVLTHSTPQAVTHHARAYHIHIQQDESHRDFDQVLWATGRAPNTQGLGLEDLKIAMNESGHVITQPHGQTSVENIYAIGDLRHHPALTPVAIASARRLCDHLFGGKPFHAIDWDQIPSVVFTHPPAASVGLSEPEAVARFGAKNVTCFESSFNPLLYALSAQKYQTKMKLVTQGPTQQVIGCHLVGEGADEMLQGFAVAIRMGACKADFDNTIAIHPTSAEELVTIPN